MASKPLPPVLPADTLDPTGMDSLERKAMRDFRVRMRKIGKYYADAAKDFPVQVAVNRSYEYRLDNYILQSVLDDTAAFVDSVLLEGGKNSLWFAEAYVGTAYRRGTAQAFNDLSRQSITYRASNETLRDLLVTEPFRRRLALIASREYEEMVGLAGGVKADMARVLTDGLGRGKSPREIAKTLARQTGMNESRANRIARTEITGALRRARWDESQDAEERYGFEMKQMHLSALSPTSRADHIARHGKLYTTDEVRDWYAVGANSINCKCNQVPMIMEGDKPLFPAVQQRAKASLKNYEAKQNSV